MGHALLNYDGKCAHIHGHSYCLEITLMGRPDENKESTKHGMVMDFKDLKRIVKEQIILRLDHGLLLNEEDPRAVLLKDEQNLITVPYQPTCENILLDIISKLQPFLPNEIQLSSAILQETTSSKATWYAPDSYSTNK